MTSLDPVLRRPDPSAVLLEALVALPTRDGLEEMLDHACEAVVAAGDFRAAVLSFYCRDFVGYGAAGEVPDGIKERFRGGYVRGDPESRRRRRRELWAQRRSGTRVVYLPAGEGPPPSSVFVPSVSSGGTWQPDDRLLVLCPGVGGLSFADDLFAVLSLDLPVTGDRPDDEVLARLAPVEGFLSSVVVHVQNRLMQDRIDVSERQNRELLSSLPSSVALLDGAGRVLMASPGAGRGAAPELVAGGSLLDVSWPVDVRAALEELLADGLAMPPTEARVSLQGGERDILLRGAPTCREVSPLDEDAAVAVVAIEDVTELRAMQAHVRRAENLHAIGRLASGVAHDFNNMLTGVIGSLSLAGMEAPEDDPSLRELLHDARAAAERGAVLTRQLQAFARPSEHLDLEPVDLLSIAERVVELLSRTVDRRISIEIEDEPGLPQVHGDARLLEHALIHVGTNACEALAARIRENDRPDEPPRVRIVLAAKRDCPHAAPAGSVRVSVEDNGIGMNASVLGQVFDPFFTLDASGRHPGIGLTLARSVIGRHGGTVELTSREGVGTEFRAWLPAVDRGEIDTMGLATAGGRVLVVDDDAAVVSVVCRMLERCGYEGAAVTSGEDAIEALRADPTGYRAIVLDYSMPGLSGEETLRSMAELGLHVPPVLLSTGDPSRFVDADLDALGVAAYLPKPYRPDALESALSRVLA
jgi:signal transduction histidine kinase